MIKSKINFEFNTLIIVSVIKKVSYIYFETKLNLVVTNSDF